MRSQGVTCVALSAVSIMLFLDSENQCGGRSKNRDISKAEASLSLPHLRCAFEIQEYAQWPRLIPRGLDDEKNEDSREVGTAVGRNRKVFERMNSNIQRSNKCKRVFANSRGKWRKKHPPVNEVLYQTIRPTVPTPTTPHNRENDSASQS